VIACAAPVPRVTLPESGVEPTAARPIPAPRTDGLSDGPSPRRIQVRFFTGRDELAVDGWCREGVWTTLEQRAAIPFVVRESWSRLGERKAQRIARTSDAVFQGVFARIRPTGDGQVDFVAEISAAEVTPDFHDWKWEGETVRMPNPSQDGYRFAGRVPAGFRGTIASWGDVTIVIDDGAKPAGDAPSMHEFRLGETLCSVTDIDGAIAEYYRVSVQPLEPIERDHDGLREALFRIQRKRVGSGMVRVPDKGWQVIGGDSG